MRSSAAVGDFRRGSVSENCRKCGKPNCVCAAPDHPGHGPRFLWTRSAGPPQDDRAPASRRRGGEGPPGGGPACGVHGDQRADHGGEREDLRGQAGCRQRMRPPCRRAKKGLFGALAQEKAAEIARLAAEAARSLGCGGAGLEAAEAVIRAGMLQAGRRHAGAAAGRRSRATAGPRVPCGQGHEAEFVSYRDKVIDTVLGPVTLTRAWYHCAACGHGLAPRDAELGVAGRVHVPGTGGDERPGRRRRAVREGRRAAGGPGRGAADRQAGRAGRRGQRRRAAAAVREPGRG